MNDYRLQMVRTQPYQKLSGAALKWIAIITMVIDHIGAVVLFRILWLNPTITEQDVIHKIYAVCRVVGRTAFPIFAFFIVEGFMHTRRAGRYALRLFLAALLSEVPFDLASGALLRRDWTELTTFMWKTQNVMFTLLLGLLAVWGTDALRRWFRSLGNAAMSCKLFMYLCFLAIGALAVAGGFLFRTDFSGFGVLSIVLMYWFYPSREFMALGGYAPLVATDSGALAGFLLLQLYSGDRGKQPKYLFYAFYAVHLLLLFGISLWLT